MGQRVRNNAIFVKISEQKDGYLSIESNGTYKQMLTYGNVPIWAYHNSSHKGKQMGQIE